MLGLKIDADKHLIAHEVGHYMTHVLAGDDAYLRIEDTAPDVDHGLGTFQPGRPLVETSPIFPSTFLPVPWEVANRPCHAPFLAIRSPARLMSQG